MMNEMDVGKEEGKQNVFIPKEMGLGWRWRMEWLQEQMQAMKDSVEREGEFRATQRKNRPKKDILAAHFDGDRETLM